MIFKVNKYSLLPWAIAAILTTPIIALVLSAMSFDETNTFVHLLDTVLSTYISNTLLLIVCVMLFSFLFAMPAAWFVATCDFPMRKTLDWLLMLPLAMPPYIIAIVYTDLFDFAGPVQQWLRALFSWQNINDYYFPDIRSLTGASLVLALALYPYLYILLRSSFSSQSSGLFQAARTLGMSPLQAFIKVSVPLSRSAIAVGLSLIAMETLGDFATVNYFAVNTLTTAIYDTWLELGSLTTAAKLSCVMLTVLVIFVMLEKYSRRKQKAYQRNSCHLNQDPFKLFGYRKWLVVSFCWGLLLCALFLPMSVLLYYTYHYFSVSITSNLINYTLNSIWLALIVATLALIVALIVNFYNRLKPSFSAKATIRLSSLGYAIPGTVVAIGVLIPLTTLDLWLNKTLVSLGGSQVGLILSGSLFILVLGYLVRFSAIAVGSVESSLSQVSPSLDTASRVLGHSPLSTIRRVNLPLIKSGMLSAFILVFIESMKELPTALLLRPFNFETLATYVYQFVSDEMIEHAALPSLMLIMLGLVPFMIVNRLLERSNP